MKSPVVKRSIVVAGHKTSVSLEEAFWNGMKEISGTRDMTLSELVGEIDVGGFQGAGHELGRALRIADRTITNVSSFACRTAGRSPMLFSK